MRALSHSHERGKDGRAPIYVQALDGEQLDASWEDYRDTETDEITKFPPYFEFGAGLRVVLQSPVI